MYLPHVKNSYLLAVRGTGLTTDHFCFLKEPLGIDDSSKEVIREASARKSVMYCFAMFWITIESLHTE